MKTRSHEESGPSAGARDFGKSAPFRCAFAIVAVALAVGLNLPMQSHSGGRALFLPLWFGAVLLVIWELVVRGLNVPAVILPPPSAIAFRLATSTGTLRVDFVQTFVKGALSGYVIGCAAAFATAIIADRFDFLRRGLLPVGNFVAGGFNPD